MRRASCFAAVLLLAAACTDAPRSASSSAARPALAYAPSAELSAASALPVVALWDTTRGRPRRVHGAFASAEPSAERAARAFLREHATLFQLRADGRDLDLARARRGLAGAYLRFRQIVPGRAALPVFGAEIIVLVAEDGGRFVVRDVNLAHRAPLAIAEPPSDVGPERALAAARAAVGTPAEDGAPEIARGVGDEPARVVYRVRLPASAPAASWEILVDAASGHVVSKRDRLVHATGSGLVFDPNPVATTGNAALADNGNATSPALDAARYQVSLPNLDGSGYLRGTWCDAHTKNVNQRAFDAGLTFDYDRSQPGFEQTNAYFHIDRAQTRLQALGFTDANGRRQEIISDGQQADNAYYDPMKKSINYGQGGVDDAEDGDVVLHEYGHAIQDDQVPGFGSGGDAGAMGEGFGDYISASINRVLSKQITDPACLGEWDSTAYATGNPPCLRRLDGTKHHPEFDDGEVHDDGEMWSSALFALDTAFGADVMTRIVIESQFSMAADETFFSASQAMLDADQNLFGGAHQDALRRRLVQQGVCRILSVPSPLGNVISSVAVSIDNPRTNGLYANLLDDTQVFSHPGAEALRLHFTTVDTEVDPTCVDGACDNIYLTDKNGDLHQILSGHLTDAESVVIPGDTVNIRLVTDGAVALGGYHVDRVDVLGSGTTSGTGGAMMGTGGSGGASTSSSSSSNSTSSSSSSNSTSTSSSTSSSNSTSSSSSSSSSGAGGEGGAQQNGQVVDMADGCGCRAAGAAPERAEALWISLGGALAALGGRRRRRAKARQ